MCRYVHIEASTQSISVPQANITFTITIDELQKINKLYVVRISTLPYSNQEHTSLAVKYFKTLGMYFIVVH